MQVLVLKPVLPLLYLLPVRFLIHWYLSPCLMLYYSLLVCSWSSEWYTIKLTLTLAFCSYAGFVPLDSLQLCCWVVSFLIVAPLFAMMPCRNRVNRGRCLALIFLSLHCLHKVIRINFLMYECSYQYRKRLRQRQLWNERRLKPAARSACTPYEIQLLPTSCFKEKDVLESLDLRVRV